MTASTLTSDASGSASSSLVSSTKLSVAARRATRGRPDRRCIPRRATGSSSSRPVRSSSVSTRRTLSSSTASSTSPARTAVGQLLAEPLRRARHLQIESGVRGRGRAVRAVPVRHHHAVEVPLVAQHREERAVLAAVRAVDLLYAVISAHVPASVTAASNGTSEISRKRALVDLGADRHPLELGVVGDEVLDRARHTLRLHAGDVSRPPCAPKGTGPRE